MDHRSRRAGLAARAALGALLVPWAGAARAADPPAPVSAGHVAEVERLLAGLRDMVEAGLAGPPPGEAEARAAAALGRAERAEAAADRLKAGLAEAETRAREALERAERAERAWRRAQGELADIRDELARAHRPIPGTEEPGGAPAPTPTPGPGPEDGGAEPAPPPPARESSQDPAWGVQARVSLECGGGARIEAVLVRAGEFTMGSPASEADRDPDEIQRRVVLTRPFYMAIHPVTRAQYRAVTGRGPGPAGGGEGDPDGDRPMDDMSWRDAAEFCRLLSIRTGRAVRLPTEAEWEYACRAGTATAYAFGDRLGEDQANFDNRHRGPTPVGAFPANAWGLHDMHGNVWEWCADWYADYPPGPAADPAGPAAGARRVVRGGGWVSHPRSCRSAFRSRGDPDRKDHRYGFRVVLDAGPEPPG